MKCAACLFTTLSVLVARPLHATTFVPMSVEDLARSSVAAVMGTVQGLTGVRSREGAIFTLVRVTVEHVVTGKLTSRVITLKEDGGTVGNEWQGEFGAPSFRLGEQVLLFLTVRRDGSLRTNHLALGKFHLGVGTDGMPWARQAVGPATMVIGSRGGITQEPLRHLSDLLAKLRHTGTNVTPAATPLMAPPEAHDPALRHEVTGAFTLQGSVRFFEPDEGAPVAFVIDARGDSILGLPASQQAIDGAFAQWNGVDAASLQLNRRGLTGDLSTPCPGTNKILFNDPQGAIPDPVNCRGTLGLGSFCTTTFESKRFNGTTFERTLRGTVTFADGWAGCPVWNPCNLAEIATHEIGHTIGLGHSSEDPAEPDPTLHDAAMYFRAHFDGRCADVRQDDAGGVRFIYPAAPPLTITTPNPLPSGSSGSFYHRALTATGATGTVTWTITGGGFPGLRLTPTGVVSGVPSTGGSGFLQVTATDAKGDFHTKLLEITVAGPIAIATSVATATGTPIATAASTPPPSSTSSPSAPATRTVVHSPPLSPSPTPTVIRVVTPTVAPACLGDCDGSRKVTVDELVVMVDIALGQTAPTVCEAGDRNRDGSITVDEVLGAVHRALQGCQLSRGRGITGDPQSWPPAPTPLSALRVPIAQS